MQAQRVNWLEAAFYFPNHDSTEALRVHMDTGVYKWVSVGFRYSDIICDVCGNSYLSYMDCPHLLGRYDEEGKLCTATYGGDLEFTEALEGSLVYLGGQQRARLIKSMVDDGQVNPERLASTPYGTDGVALKEAEDLARRYGGKRFFAVGADVRTPSDDNDGEAAPVGLYLADEAQHVLACVGDFVNRALEVRSMRASKGKQLSASTAERVRELADSLNGMLEAVGTEQLAAGTDGDLRAEAAALVARAEADAIMLGVTGA
jgi:hypothetical protein